MADKEKSTAKTTAGKSTASKKTAAKQTAVKQTKAKTSVSAETAAVKASDGAAEQAAPANKKLFFLVLTSAVAFLLVLIIIVGAVVGTKPVLSTDLPQVLSTKTVSGDRPDYKDSIVLNPVTSVDVDEGEIFTPQYTATTQVGYSATILDDNVERVKPVKDVRDEREWFSLGEDVEAAIEAAGTVRYPKYGYTMSSVLASTDARDALINESDYLCAYGTYNNSGNGNNDAGTYNKMDKDGYLYFVNNGTTTQSLNYDDTPRQLYEHTAAEGMYLEGFQTIPMIDDNQPAVKKQLTIRPRGYSSYSVTGLYAPAGEVIKIEMSEDDMNATGGITIHIGQALYNGQSNNIWTAKGQMQRFPNILNTMVVNKSTAEYDENTRVYTAYVGSFIGGPIYIRNTSATFTATITGGLTYQHFILGYTTPEEFEANKSTTVPYFDLEVWNYGVLHSGPLYYAMAFSYDDLYKAAVLWEKVSSVTTTGSNQGIVFLYDPFVAAGAAVAFPGRSSVNCPMGWMTSSLNYNSIVTSGSWGNFHEYHHNFQGYGVGNGGEVTNNGLNLVSYALFTKISSNRGIGTFGAQGLGGWNNYTSATWALEETLKIARPNESPSNGNQGLALYATLLHNFGADNYMKAKVAGGGQSYAAYMNAWQNVTHNNMYYYFNEILKGTGISDNADPSYPVFVPVSCVYQTGRSYMYDGEKKYFKTMQPYVIPWGEEFNIDLSRYDAPGGMYAGGSIVMPEGFTYRIKSVTQPEHGTIEVVDNFNLKYIPDENNKLSGQIIVTLEIIKDNRAFTVDDIDLVLEFEQSHETNKMTLERTTYYYTAENAYTDARQAYESNYAGYEEVDADVNHSNPVQNANTDIWFYPDTEANREKYDTAIESYFAHDNSVVELRGKLYFQEEGKYRIYLRGRQNCAVYYSLDGKNYTLGAYIADTNTSAAFRPNEPNTYFDLELGAGDWVYFKEVLIVKNISASQASYIGLGVGTWQDPLYTMVEKFYDAEGNEVPSIEDENYDHSVTYYYDNAGHEIDADVVAAAQKTPPTNGTYVNGYRQDYEFETNTTFYGEYFYKRNYTYTYSEVYNNLTNQAFVGDHGCFYDKNRTDFRPEYLFDGDLTTSCSSAAQVSASAPWEFTVDLGKVIEANRFVLTGRLNNGAANQNQTPNSITLYVGETLDDMKEVASFDHGAVNGVTMAFNFETSTFRYYKLFITSTVQGRFGAIANIEFSSNISGGAVFTPDSSAFTYVGNWHTEQAQSTFGHVYVGETNAQMMFKFTGTRLALLSSDAFGRNFEVTIDGVKVNSIELKAITGGYGASYITQLLENKEHTVVIKCLGEANIDSVVVYT